MAILSNTTVTVDAILTRKGFVKTINVINEVRRNCLAKRLFFWRNKNEINNKKYLMDDFNISRLTNSDIRNIILNKNYFP